MEAQCSWQEAGSEAVEALAVLVDEKGFKRQLEAIVQEREALEDKAEKLEVKLLQERTDLDKQKTVIFAGMREAETKLRADMAKELGTTLVPGKKPVNYLDSYVDEAIIKALDERARKILSLRKRALGVMQMERDLAKLRMEISQKAEAAFQARREPARRFLLALMQVAGVSIKYVIQDSSLGETKRWSDEMKKLDEHLAIAEGTAEHFWPLHYQATSADDCLSMALMVPEADVNQVLHAWWAVRFAGGKAATLSYDDRRVLRWRFRKARLESERISIKSSDYDSGSTDARRAEAR